MEQHEMTTIDGAAHSIYCLSMRFSDAVNTKEVSAENAEEWLALLMELYVGAMRLPEIEPDDDSISRKKNAIPQPVIK
jgi:DNA-directed RNA polymerase subunit H (RpoH/RPB5)